MNSNSAMKIGGICLLLLMSTLAPAAAQVVLETGVVACGAVDVARGGGRLVGTVGQAAVGGPSGARFMAGFWARPGSRAASVVPQQLPILDLTVAPSICTDHVSISTPIAGAPQLTILDALGRVVLRSLESPTAGGVLSVVVDLSALSPGRYYVIVDDGRTRRVGSFAILRTAGSVWV